MSIFDFAVMRPASVRSQVAVPGARKVSMTYVETPEAPAAYGIAMRQARGVSGKDKSTLNARAGEGVTFPGWVGVSTAMVVPGSVRGFHAQ